MRIAVFHALPAGGGLRALRELLRRTHRVHDYDLYSIDLGRIHPRPAAVQDGLGTAVRARHPYSPAQLPAPGRLARVADIELAVRLQRRIAADIDRAGYDLAFVHHDHFTSSPALLTWLRTPSLYYCQEPRRRSFERAAAPPAAGGVVGIAWHLYEQVLRRRDLRAAQRAGTILCNSVFSAENILRAYGRAARVCRLGVDERVFRPSDAPRRRSVIAVGALDAIKGHELAIEALAAIPASRRPGLDIVHQRGTPARAAALHRLARARSVELRLHRDLDDETLAAHYGTAQATLCLAMLEPFGLTTIESLSCGTPVVAVNEGGYREVVEPGVTGLLVERDVIEVAAAIDRVCSGGLNRPAAELRARVLPDWTWDAAAERLLDAIAAATNTGGRLTAPAIRAAV